MIKINKFKMLNEIKQLDTVYNSSIIDTYGLNIFSSYKKIKDVYNSYFDFIQ